VEHSTSACLETVSTLHSGPSLKVTMSVCERTKHVEYRWKSTSLLPLSDDLQEKRISTTGSSKT